MNVSVNIRMAHPEDVEAIHHITQEAFSKYQHDLGMDGPVAALKESREDILRDMAQKMVLIGFVNDEPVGSIRCEVFDELAYISRFGVLPNVQKSGIGGMLISKVEELCREMSIKAIALHTSSRMYGLIRFYYGKGYFIHSTTFDRGYIRALLVHELENPGTYDLEPIMCR